MDLSIKQSTAAVQIWDTKCRLRNLSIALRLFTFLRREGQNSLPLRGVGVEVGRPCVCIILLDVILTSLLEAGVVKFGEAKIRKDLSSAK